MKLCVIITVSQNLYSLYRDQFKYLQSKGFEITAIASPGPEHELLRKQGIRTVEIPMRKRPSPLFDLYSLFRLWLHLLTNRYNIVSVSTPKASLLGTLAGKLSFHKNLIFTLRGRAYENEIGIKLKFYQFIDRFICFSSSKVFCISKELREDFVNNRYVEPEKILVIGEGSSNGVDLSRFTKSPALAKKANEVRSFFNIAPDDKVLLYSGRLRTDKGINELVSAFELLLEIPNLHLIIQGAMDDTDPLNENTLRIIDDNPRIHLASWAYDVEKYFQCADIFVFPSYREGFGNVAIEASAMELPVVSFDVIGCRESVRHNETGMLVKPKSSIELANAIKLLLNDHNLATRLGKQGRLRVEEHFDSKLIWEGIYQLYSQFRV